MTNGGFQSRSKLNETWTSDEICDYYDSHPMITLAQLSSKCGWTVYELKCILLGDE